MKSLRVDAAAAGDDVEIGSVRRDRRVLLSGYAAFVLIGWTGLLVPSIVGSIEHTFRQSDAAIGLYYFVFAVSYAAGGAGGGLLADRIGRGSSLPLAAISLGFGLAALAVAPAWWVFLAAAVPVGVGAGAIDGGVNGLFLELHPGRGGALNLLHLFYSLGALAAPISVGFLAAAGLPWPAVIAAGAVAALAISALLAIVGLPRGHARHAAAGEPSLDPGLLTAPMVALGIGLAAFVACSVGTASWLVRFLGSAPVGVAAAGLALFSGGQALGRLIASRAANAFPAVSFAAACAALSGIGVFAAVLAPSLAASIGLFALAGLAQGPVYPMIMTLGGMLQPRRSNVVSGFLTAAAVLGRLVYPPLIGLVSVSYGIGTGLLGAGALSVVAAAALVTLRALGPASVRARS